MEWTWGHIDHQYFNIESIGLFWIKKSCKVNGGRAVTLRELNPLGPEEPEDEIVRVLAPTCPFSARNNNPRLNNKVRTQAFPSAHEPAIFTALIWFWKCLVRNALYHQDACTGLSAYELKRLENIAQKEAFLSSLKIWQVCGHFSKGLISCFPFHLPSPYLSLHPTLLLVSFSLLPALSLLSPTVLSFSPSHLFLLYSLVILQV